MSSSDASTVTGDSFAENKETGLTEDVDLLVDKYTRQGREQNKEQNEAPRDSTQDSGFALTADEIIQKYLSGQTTDNIISQYAQQAQAIKSSFAGMQIFCNRKILHD